MRKKTIFVLCLILGIVPLTNNLYAGFADIVLSGAESWEIITRANHWQAFLAGSILTGCWFGLGRMKQTQHKEIAKGRAFLLYTTCAICGCLIIAEYWAAILFIAGCFYDIFEWSRDLAADIFDKITD